ISSFQKNGEMIQGGSAPKPGKSMQLPQDKLDALETRFAYIEAALSGGGGAEEFVRLSKEHAELAPIVAEIVAYNKAVRDRAEIEALDERLPALEHAIRIALLPRDAADERSIILEIRGGTGGDEAALFAGDLFRMYERYAAAHGWKVTVMEESAGDAGGFKEV